jgi:hypothetical protein
MKSLRITLPVVLISTLLLSIPNLTFAQADAHKHAAQADAPKSDAQKSFDQLKALAGSWQASVTTDPPMKDMGNGEKTEVLLRVTSRGNALVHEMGKLKGNDPTKYDHPVTMFYLDNDRLILTHYCDAGNRPRMAARTSPDGKTLELTFLTLPATRSTAIWNTRCSLLLTRTITLKTGPLR